MNIVDYFKQYNVYSVLSLEDKLQIPKQTIKIKGGKMPDKYVKSIKDYLIMLGEIAKSIDEPIATVKVIKEKREKLKAIVNDDIVPTKIVTEIAKKELSHLDEKWIRILTASTPNSKTYVKDNLLPEAEIKFDDDDKIYSLSGKIIIDTSGRQKPFKIFNVAYTKCKYIIP